MISIIMDMELKIENIVNRYDGDIRYKIESNKFVVDIMIKK